MKVKTHILKIGRLVGNDGVYSKIDLIREHIKKNGLGRADAR